MSLLAGLTTSNDIAQETDRLGGGFVLDSDVYEMVIKLAYLQVSGGGATGVVLHMESPDGTKKLRNTQWVTSGKAKGCLNYYIDKNKQKQYLPGFNLINGVCLLTTGKELSQMTVEKRQVPLYNSEAKREVPTPTDVITDLLNTRILVGVKKVISNKQVKVEGTNPPEYVDTNERRETNDIDKLFHADNHMTVAEIRAGMKEADFITKWLDKNKGVPQDNFKEVTGGAGGAMAGLPTAGGTVPNLFAKTN